MMISDKLKTAISKVLEQRWIDDEYGRFHCRSCGANKFVDYGDHKTPTKERVESCSPNCPYRILQEEFM